MRRRGQVSAVPSQGQVAVLPDCARAVAALGVVARRGRSSEVERQLPKLNVVGSIPIARSKLFNSLDLPPDRIVT